MHCTIVLKVIISWHLNYTKSQKVYIAKSKLTKAITSNTALAIKRVAHKVIGLQSTLTIK